MYEGGITKYYNITLTEEEMLAVYAAFEESTFKSFPKKFVPTTDTIAEVEPNFYYIISSNYGDDDHRVYYSDATTDRAMRKAGEPFFELYKALFAIVKSNREINMIPESNIGWE